MMPIPSATHLTTFAGQWQRQPLVVVVRVTTRCGLACRYCGFSRDQVRSRVDIDTDGLLALGLGLADYQSESGRRVLVSWLGGEPYGWRDLWLISREFRNSYSLTLGVTTAGTALASRIVRRRTLDCFSEVTLSVDGNANAHDAVRPSPGGYARLRDNCMRLRDEDPLRQIKLRINMVLMRSNIASFAETCRQLATWGVDEISFNQLGGNDRPEFYPDNRLHADQFLQFTRELPSVRKELAEQGVVITGSADYLQRIASTIQGRAISIADCQPASTFLFVDELGRVSPCSFTSHVYQVSMRELTTAQSIADLSPQLAAQRSHTACSACSDCHATHMFDKFAHNQPQGAVP